MFGVFRTIYFFLLLTLFPCRLLILSTKFIASSKLSVLIIAIRHGMNAIWRASSRLFQVLYSRLKVVKRNLYTSKKPLECGIDITLQLTVTRARHSKEKWRISFIIHQLMHCLWTSLVQCLMVQLFSFLRMSM